MTMTAPELRQMLVSRVEDGTQLKQSPNRLGPTMDPAQIQHRSFGLLLGAVVPKGRPANGSRNKPVKVVQDFVVRVMHRMNPSGGPDDIDPVLDDVRATRNAVLTTRDDDVREALIYWTGDEKPIELADGARYQDINFQATYLETAE